MDTDSVLTLRLAEAIGLYVAATGAGALVAPERWRAIGPELERSPGLVLLMGIVTFAIGSAMLGVHHALTDPLADIVTAIAAIAAVEGLLLLVTPEAMIAFGRPFMARPRLWAMFALVAGIALFLAGLTGRANPMISA
jgi:hypothetical protein